MIAPVDQCGFVVEDAIRQTCGIWQSKTYYSHFIYIKLLLIWFIFQRIRRFWNPHYDLTYYVDIFKRDITFYEGKPIEEIMQFIIVLLGILIIDVFYIQHIVVDKTPILEVLKRIWETKLLLR